jgi:hypothetical protein
MYFCPVGFFNLVLPTIVLVMALLEATEKSKAALYFAPEFGAKSSNSCRMASENSPAILA